MWNSQVSRWHFQVSREIIFPGEQLIRKVRRCVYFSATVLLPIVALLRENANWLCGFFWVNKLWSCIFVYYCTMLCSLLYAWQNKCIIIKFIMIITAPNGAVLCPYYEPLNIKTRESERTHRWATRWPQFPTLQRFKDPNHCTCVWHFLIAKENNNQKYVMTSKSSSWRQK